MKDLKNCFFSISDGSIPYLYDLMEDLDNNRVRNFTMNPAAPVPALEIPGGSYTITDNSDAQCVIEGFDEVTADFIEKMYQRKNEIPWIILETPRTIIKEISLSDIDELFELYKDPDIIRFIPPLQPTKREELDFQKEYIKKMYGFFGYGFWNVIDRDSNKLIGRAGLSNREGFEYLELGYLFSKPYRGKGIATEVCTAIIKYAVEILGAERLNAFIQPENTGSVHLAEKLGFKYTGEEIESMGNWLRRYVLNMSI